MFQIGPQCQVQKNGINEKKGGFVLKIKDKAVVNDVKLLKKRYKGMKYLFKMFPCVK